MLSKFSIDVLTSPLISLNKNLTSLGGTKELNQDLSFITCNPVHKVSRSSSPLFSIFFYKFFYKFSTPIGSPKRVIAADLNGLKSIFYIVEKLEQTSRRV
ncbi:hypothetical protein BpHYR1_024194 [Brachionus plicatilis]|uniref:Uncharacterized protein n=1 Tax=Brachionus plicatilis TaxID=10195 RepID=A0A3M7SIY5_BRAPC|nr:hypothetical protein BpHYR1_024194 [Brachionus plicatilis]